MSVNIGGDASDPFYRYKRPALTHTLTREGGSVKTIITNTTEVCKALHTQPVFVCKWMGCSLSTNSSINRYGLISLGGQLTVRQMEECLEAYITLFVLCDECSLPETTLGVSKSGKICKACAACGKSRSVKGDGRVFAGTCKTMITLLTQFKPSVDGTK